MSKTIKRAILCGMAAVYIFTTADGTIKRPALREISSTNAELSSFPDTGVLKSGALKTGKQYFDLFCSGSYSNEKSPALIIEGFDVIPNPVKVDKGGKLVVAKPQPMGTIRLPEGHSGWVHITLQAVSNSSNYLCLGITRRGRKEGNWQLFDADGHKEKYIGMEDSDILEFFPLISLTEVADGYTAMKEGEAIKSDISDFSSTYRVQAAYAGEVVMQRCACDLGEVTGINEEWRNYGTVDIGLVNGKNQLLIINWENGHLASSSDGIHWFDAGSVRSTTETDTNWDAGSKYGNDVWCAVNSFGTIKRSLDGAITWENSSTFSIDKSYAFTFASGLFVIIDDRSVVRTSTDATNWNSNTIDSAALIEALGYGNGKWLCANNNGKIYTSENGFNWEEVRDSSIDQFKNRTHAAGAIPCINGYFYMIDKTASGIIRSSNWINWYKVADIGCSDHLNIAYFNNKLYLFGSNGDHCHIGHFYPGDVDSI